MVTKLTKMSIIIRGQVVLLDCVNFNLLCVNIYIEIKFLNKKREYNLVEKKLLMFKATQKHNLKMQVWLDQLVLILR